MDHMLTLDQAAIRYNIALTLLHQLIDTGRLRASMFNNQLIIREDDLMVGLPKEQRPEYIKNAQLKGVKIGMREASRKYGVHVDTISGWVARGYIAILERQGKQKLLLDEADIAYCVEVHRANPGRGHRLFNPDGTPR